MPSNNISCHFKPRHRYGFIFQCQAGVTGLVDEASCRWEETVLKAWDVHNSPAGDQSRSWFGRTAARSSYSLSISFHHTLLPTLYQKCVDIIPSHLDPKIVPELPRCGSAFFFFFFFFFVVVRLFSFFLFYHDVTLTAWEHSCFDHRLLTKVLCAPFSCSSHSSQIPRSPAKNNDSAFHLFFFFFILVQRKKYTRGGKLLVCAFQTLRDKSQPVDAAVWDCRGWDLFTIVFFSDYSSTNAEYIHGNWITVLHVAPVWSTAASQLSDTAASPLSSIRRAWDPFLYLLRC